jgi:hypothetical protein
MRWHVAAEKQTGGGRYAPRGGGCGRAVCPLGSSTCSEQPQSNDSRLPVVLVVELKVGSVAAQGIRVSDRVLRLDAS